MSSSNYPKKYRYRRIVQAKLYIDKHFTKDIDLDKISDEAHFSKYHFLRLYKSAYGKTPNQYLTERRIDLACKLLQENQLSISEICFEVGFKSLGSFSSLFNRKTGSSPSEYRVQTNHKTEEIIEEPRTVIPDCFVKAYS